MVCPGPTPPLWNEAITGSPGASRAMQNTITVIPTKVGIMSSSRLST